MKTNMNRSEIKLEISKIREDIEKNSNICFENAKSIKELKHLENSVNINKYCDINKTIENMLQDSIISEKIIEILQKKINYYEALLNNENIIL